MFIIQLVKGTICKYKQTQAINKQICLYTNNKQTSIRCQIFIMMLILGIGHTMINRHMKVSTYNACVQTTYKNTHMKVSKSSSSLSSSHPIIFVIGVSWWKHKLSANNTQTQTQWTYHQTTQSRHHHTCKTKESETSSAPCSLALDIQWQMENLWKSTDSLIFL